MSTLIGLLTAIFAVYMSFYLEAMQFGHAPNLANLLNGPAGMIVLVGSAGAALFMNTFGNIFSLPKFFLMAMLPNKYKAGDIIVACQRMADKARQFGLPALTSEIPIAVDEFMRRGIKLLVSGVDSRTLRAMMEDEISMMKERHAEKFALMENIGGLLPTMGMVGTIMGMINTLGNLEDTSKLGPSIATAMIATFYGVAGANLIFIPLGKKLQKKSHDEAQVKTMLVRGLVAVHAGESSQMVGQRMKAFLDEKQRMRVEGGKGLSKKKTDKHVELATYMQAADQERAMAFLAEFKSESQANRLGQDDVKNMLAELINLADDKVITKDFCNEFMKIKEVKKLPKGAKRKGKKKPAGATAKGGAKGKKAAAADEEE